MTWNDVTVFQWQQLMNLFANRELQTELDLSVKAASILTSRTEHQIDSMPLKQLGAILEEIKFIHDEIQPKAAKWIKANGKRYKCIYDIRNMPAARYIESKHFAQDVNANLHKIMACMVIPQKKTWHGWVDEKYNAAKHSEYAEDILAAPIVSVLGSVVFFYQVFRLWTKSSKDYLMKQMKAKGMTDYQAEAAFQSLCSILDGFTKPHWLPNMKESHWNRLSKSKP